VGCSQLPFTVFQTVLCIANGFGDHHGTVAFVVFGKEALACFLRGFSSSSKRDISKVQLLQNSKQNLTAVTKAMMRKRIPDQPS